MRVLIAAVGKLKQGPERELFAHYLARAEALGRRLSLTPLTAIEVAESKASSDAARCQAEAQALRAKIPGTHQIVCLDRAGEPLSSEAFARWLGGLRDQGVGGAAFVIGGADGLARTFIEEAGKTVSFGPMTLPHGLARVVLAEQIYRAMTILSGHPYHRA